MSESCDLRGLRHCLTFGLGLALMHSNLFRGVLLYWPGDECVVAYQIMLLLTDI